MQTTTTLKQETIIAAALQRFSHFGVHKTTLTEIAGDLYISKPTLFYYFHDKDSLVISVLEKLVHDFHDDFRRRVADATSTEEGLLLFLEAKKEFFKTHLQFALQINSIHFNRSSLKVLRMIARANNTHVAIINDLLSNGVKKGELSPMNTHDVATLILEVTRSIDIAFGKSNPIPTEKDIDQLSDKQKKLVSLLFNGLNSKSPSENNHYYN